MKFREFMDGYLELLKRRFGTKRVNCNIVYQEYIAYREHIHMNSTQWETLTEFIKWLGREGTEIISFKSFYFESSVYFLQRNKAFKFTEYSSLFLKHMIMGSFQTKKKASSVKFICMPVMIIVIITVML